MKVCYKDFVRIFRALIIHHFYQLQYGLFVTNAKHSSRQIKNKYARDKSGTKACAQIFTVLFTAIPQPLFSEYLFS